MRTIYKYVFGSSPIVEGDLWDDTMAQVRTSEPQQAFRASYALEKAYAIDRTPIIERFDVFLTDWLATDNKSVKRIYTKMLYDMLLWERITITDATAERIAERAFALLIDNTPFAVQAWSIELLALLSKRLGWIEEHLTPLVRQMSENPEASPGIQSATRRYLKRR